MRRVSDPAIDDDAIRHIAALAQLTVDETTLPELRNQLATILSYAARLQDVEVSGADAWTHAAESAPGLRADQTRPSLSAEQALRAAPESFAGLFRVPRVLSG